MACCSFLSPDEHTEDASCSELGRLPAELARPDGRDTFSSPSSSLMHLSGLCWLHVATPNREQECGRLWRLLDHSLLACGGRGPPFLSPWPVRCRSDSRSPSAPPRGTRGGCVTAFLCVLPPRWSPSRVLTRRRSEGTTPPLQTPSQPLAGVLGDAAPGPCGSEGRCVEKSLAVSDEGALGVQTGRRGCPVGSCTD